ncbi:MAG: DUF6442 family protein [Treponema sp.]|nr:DUF6442 family protein [Treponema sp.]
MTKEEILEKSRNENKNRDLYDMEVQKLAFTISHLAFMFLCALALVLEYVFTRRINMAYCMIYFGVISVIFFVKYIKMHKLHELFVLLSQFALFAASTIIFIFQLLGR